MSAAEILNATNWCSLALCLVNKKYTVERALDCIGGAILDTVHRKDITNADIEDMIKLRKEMTHKDIGELYGLSESAAWRRIKRYEGSLKRANN